MNALLADAGSTHAVSRLGVVELHSVFAKKIRTGHLLLPDFERLTRLFRQDVKGKRFQVVRISATHFQSAISLLKRIAPTQSLRTLDALQLAVALDLTDPIRPVTFVCADVTLCGIAAAEGLTVINPEVP